MLNFQGFVQVFDGLDTVLVKKDFLVLELFLEIGNLEIQILYKEIFILTIFLILLKFCLNSAERGFSGWKLFFERQSLRFKRVDFGASILEFISALLEHFSRFLQLLS